MAGRTRKNVRKKFRYFFINSELHKILRVSRPEDIVFAWNYKQGKRVAYVWTDVQKNMQHAYSLTQVSGILNRHKKILRDHILEQKFSGVEMTYSIDERKSPGVYYISEDGIRQIYDYLKTLSRGRPRNDGETVVWNLPTKAELDAILRQEIVLYVKNENGEFTPVWKQPEW